LQRRTFLLRTTGLAAALLVALLAALPAAALDVLLRSPRRGQPAFGFVTMEAEVLSGLPVAEVLFKVDGRVVARLTEPPWKVDVDVGQDNVAHRFEVEVRDSSGATAGAHSESAAVKVDEELDLELQQLYVTVPQGGGYDLTLAQDAFKVLDDGQRQSLVTFERGDAPLTAMVLLDTSDSMRGDRLATALAGADVFLYGLRPLDEARLTLFSDRRIRASSFAHSADEITYGLHATRAAGGTALNDYLYYALRLLEGRQGRRVIVVLSDGIDTDSFLGADDVRWAARRSQAVIYWIRLRTVREAGTFSSSWRNRQEHAHELSVLEQTVAESGGAVREIDGVEGAAKAFGEILRELRSQYVLGYYPSRNEDDGEWHDVRVEVRKRTVRTRNGYIDY
jgi:Ca-activated chloride channel family protein